MNGYKPRSEVRTRVLIRSQLRGAGPARDACVLDVSTRGLLATCADPPRRGAFVELVIHGQSLTGQVRWSNGRRFGMTLRERVSVVALVANDGGPILLPERRKVPRQPMPAAALISVDPSSFGRFTTFLAWILAASVAGMLLMHFTASALSSLAQASHAMEASG
ncbi:MAG TPA: PilZ domain-containing protein [Sphingomonadaceae bacterium]